MRQPAGAGSPALGEWQEQSLVAYHLRRRLSAAEQERVGPAVDIRGQPEALARVRAIGPAVRLVPPGMIAAEIG